MSSAARMLVFLVAVLAIVVVMIVTGAADDKAEPSGSVLPATMS